MNRLLVPLLALAAFFAAAAAPADPQAETHQSSYATAYKATYNSVVLVQSQDSSCTGSIVESDDQGSTVITAAHCLTGATKLTVFVHNDFSSGYRARVIRAGNPGEFMPSGGDADLALLRIGAPNLAVLKLSDRADPGTEVIKIGYPRLTLALGDAAPQLHTGIVASPHSNNWYVEYTASTDHGDSGGPVIDAETDRLVAVVLGNLPKYPDSFIGPGPRAIHDFCEKAGVNCGASGITVAQSPDWSLFGPAVHLDSLPGLLASARCLHFDGFNVWDIRLANNYAQTLLLDINVTSDKESTAALTSIELPNDGLYRVGPFMLRAACGDNFWYHTNNIRVKGTNGAPQRLDSQYASREPTGKASDDRPKPTVGDFKLPWSKFPNEPGLSLATRCIALNMEETRGNYIWQARLHSPRDIKIDIGFGDMPGKDVDSYFTYTVRANTTVTTGPYLSHTPCSAGTWNYRNIVDL